ncbi:MAG: thioredoxin-dependent thiol peroxidase [Herpetosiphonaceae bacterium]|nr:thioredoxin-dependent thiol peroxidase [Herpetosiphonaceae bacterium]
MTTLNIGDMAPEFALPADNGETVRLADFRGKKVILYFYPKDDTPGCTTQACGFRDNYPQITERNAVVIGVSPDDVKSHLKFKTKFDLPFLLVADTEHTLAEAYGVWGEKSMYGKKFQGVTRSHFVIDEEGRLLDVQGKISPADSVAQALKLI